MKEEKKNHTNNRLLDKKHKHRNRGTSRKSFSLVWFSKIQDSQGHKATLSQKTMFLKKGKHLYNECHIHKGDGDMHK